MRQQRNTTTSTTSILWRQTFWWSSYCQMSNIVHALPLSPVATFSENADSKFLPFLENHLKSMKWIDIVWDEYQVVSLKEAAREQRGKGVRWKVAGNVKLPQNWQAFPEDSSNKKELFNFLTTQVETASFPADKVVYITSGKTVINFWVGLLHRHCSNFSFMSINSWWIVLLTVSSFILGETSISSCPYQMRSCNHEEADTQILIHVKDALDKWGRSV